MFFPPGKLPPDVLDLLIKAYTTSDERIAIGPAIGEDATAIDMGDTYLLVKTDPITFVSDDIGTYAVCINANDIATMGGRPLWFLATILLPESETSRDLVESIFHQISSACRNMGVSFCGGHTEITLGIDRPIVIGMMLGEVAKDGLITTAGAKAGDDIILTKAIAIEATSIIAREKADELAYAYGKEFVEKCRNLTRDPGISVSKDAAIVLRSGTIHSMHDPTEGGLASGLHEVASAAHVGLLVEEEKIPILDECRTLSSLYGLDPLGLIASGSLLVTLGPACTGDVIRALKDDGITAAKIGRVLPPEEGVKISRSRQILDLPLFQRDEITKIFL